MKIKKSVSLFFAFAIIGCEVPYDIKLEFQNTSNTEIFVTSVEKKDDIHIFLGDCKQPSWDTFGHYLPPDSSARFPAWYSWESFIEKLENKKVHFYVFDADTFRMFRAGLIDSSYVHYQYLEFSKNELQKINWHVLYSKNL